jgi:hypothetical protein
VSDSAETGLRKRLISAIVIAALLAAVAAGGMYYWQSRWLNRQMMRLLESEWAPLELVPGRYLFFGLYLRDGRKQQELADTIGVDKAAATRAIIRLSDPLL